MKKYWLLLLLSYSLSTQASVGHSSLYIKAGQDSNEHAYWGLHGGGIKTKSVKNFGDFTDDFGSTKNNLEISFSSGYTAGLLIGYQSGAWRFEGDLSWWESNHNEILIDDVSSTATRAESGKGKTNAFAGMLNVYFDVLDPNEFAVTPIVGIGAGAAIVNTQIAQSIATTKTDTKVAYNYMLGAGLEASDALTLQVLYKHLNTSSAPKALLNRPFKSDAVEFGFRYHF